MRYCDLQQQVLAFLTSSLLLWVVVLILPSALFADETGNHRAFLLAVSEYESPAAPDLPLVENDLVHLAETLITYGQFQKKHLLQISETKTLLQQISKTKTLKPTSKIVKANFTKWLKQATAKDSILVYFTGHGFRDSEGNLYLATSDFDLKHPAETGIPVTWFRQQISDCKAGFKLLILDSCHAGSEKDIAEDVRVTAKDLGTPFEDLKDVVTLASSQADEKSRFFFEKKRSLFSFWLTEGLKGHADRDQNGNVDIDELYKYVSRRVRHSAKVQYNKSQTPVRIVRSGVVGVPVVVHLKAQPLKKTLANMAEHISIVMHENKLRQLGVLEFMDNTNTLQEKLGGKFGLLGKYCAEEMERQLAELKLDGGFGLVNRKRLRKALHEQGFKIDDLSSNIKLAGLSKSLDSLPVVLIGMFQNRKGNLVYLRCNLQQTTGFEELGNIGGIAELSLDEWAMLGHSVAIRTEDHRVNAFSTQDVNESIAAHVVERLDERSQAGHILQDPIFPFDVQLIINGKSRKGIFRGNDYFVPVEKGEVYAIRITNKQGRKGKTAVMKVLVDGLDTLPSANVSEKALNTEYWGLPVTHLSEARDWILDPNDVPSEQEDVSWEQRGFVIQTGEKGKLREFTIVDAVDSLAGRQGFTDQIGLITVAFYRARRFKETSRTVGTVGGKEREENLEERQGIVAGNLIGVVHLRYVDAKALDQ